MEAIRILVVEDDPDINQLQGYRYPDDYPSH